MQYLLLEGSCLQQTKEYSDEGMTVCGIMRVVIFIKCHRTPAEIFSCMVHIQVVVITE